MKTMEQLVEEYEKQLYALIEIRHKITSLQDDQQQLYEQQQVTLAAIWLMRGGFQVGDILVDRKGRRGRLEYLRLDAWGKFDADSLRPSMKSRIALVNKDGSVGNRIVTLYQGDEWKKAP